MIVGLGYFFFFNCLTRSVTITPNTNPKTAVSTYPPDSAEIINAPYSDCVAEIAEPEKIPITAKSAIKVKPAAVVKTFVTFLSCFCRMIPARRLIYFKASSFEYFMFSSSNILFSISCTI